MSLSALLERVEACQGLDRELDAAIEHETRFYRGLELGLAPWQIAVWRHVGNGEVESQGTRYAAPAYTASVDAALALIGRVLPGWSWSLTVHPGDTPKAARAGWDTVCTIYRLDDDYAVERTPGYFSHKSPALALCAALLAAMIGEEAKP